MEQRQGESFWVYYLQNLNHNNQRSTDPAQGIGDSNGDILYSGLDPNSANPRQLVTLSMLYAYADMRGPPNASQPDPVMKSLYPTATQDGMARPLRFDPPGDEDIEGWVSW